LFLIDRLSVLMSLVKRGFTYGFANQLHVLNGRFGDFFLSR